MGTLRFTLCLLVACALACAPSARQNDRDRDTDRPHPDAGEITRPDAGEITRPDAGTVEQNHAPSVSPITPAGGSGDVIVTFVVFDPESDPVTVVAQWSEDGSTWKQLSAATALTNLPSSSDGLEQSLVWRSALDVPGRLAQVRVRLTPRDPRQTGAPAQTGLFTVDNRATQPVNNPPSVQWRSVPSVAQGNTTLSFTCKDAESDTVVASIQYRILNGSWRTATLSPSSGGSFPASPSGLVASVVWQSASDIPSTQQNVQLRVQLDDGQLLSAWDESVLFTVDNQPPQPTGSGVRISEVNAGRSEDWFELENLGSQSVSLSGYSLRWTQGDGANAGTISFPSASAVGSSLLTLSPGARRVVTDAARPSSGAEAQVIYLSTSSATNNIAWGSASPGALELKDSSGGTVDFVRWEGSATAPGQGSFIDSKTLYLPNDQVSLVRVGSTDTDSANDFCTAPATRNATNAGCLAAAPSSARVRLSELSAGADVSSAFNNQRWVELVNLNTSSSINLSGWTLTTESSTAGEVVLGNVTVPANGRFLVRDGSGTNSSAVQFTGGSELAFGAGGAVSLRDPSGAPQDFVRFGGSQVPPPPPLAFASSPPVSALGSASTLVRAEGTSDVSPSRWCVSSGPTPGTSNAGCRQAPQSGGVKLSEIVGGSIFLVNGGIEITNTGGTTVNLTDYRLSWPASALEPTGGATIGNVVLPPDQRAYFEECNVLAPTTGCVGPLPWSQLGSLEAGYVELLDYAGNSVDFVRWGSSTAQPTSPGSWIADRQLQFPNNDSLGRRGPIYSDTNRASDWCAQTRSPRNVNPNSCLP